MNTILKLTCPIESKGCVGDPRKCLSRLYTIKMGVAGANRSLGGRERRAGEGGHGPKQRGRKEWIKRDCIGLKRQVNNRTKRHFGRWLYSACTHGYCIQRRDGRSKQRGKERGLTREQTNNGPEVQARCLARSSRAQSRAPVLRIYRVATQCQLLHLHHPLTIRTSTHSPGTLLFRIVQSLIGRFPRTLSQFSLLLFSNSQ